MSDTDEVSEYNEIKTPPLISPNSSHFKRQCGCNNDPECCRKSDLNYYHGFPQGERSSLVVDRRRRSWPLLPKPQPQNLMSINLCLELVKEKKQLKNP
jgi:hypothetical protein